MELKILKQAKTQLGYTFLEIMVVTGIIMVLLTMLVMTLNPSERMMKARDNKRISDIQTLDRMINEYLIDLGNYPDLVDTLRDSTTLPDGNTNLASSTAGWIDANFSKYNSKLPLDPLNTDAFIYSYFHDATSYELNAVLEILVEYAATDGGNDDAVYELGNNLQLISP